MNVETNEPMSHRAAHAFGASLGFLFDAVEVLSLFVGIFAIVLAVFQLGSPIASVIALIALVILYRVSSLKAQFWSIQATKVAGVLALIWIGSIVYDNYDNNKQVGTGMLRMRDAPPVGTPGHWIIEDAPAKGTN